MDAMQKSMNETLAREIISFLSTENYSSCDSIKYGATKSNAAVFSVNIIT